MPNELQNTAGRYECKSGECLGLDPQDAKSVSGGGGR